MDVSGRVREDSAFSVLLRVEHNGAAAVQSDVQAIEYQIYSHDSTTAHTEATSLTVSDVIFDTLQTDSRWDTDLTGYNFRHDVASTVFPAPDAYDIEYKITFTGPSVVQLDPVRIAVRGVKST